MRGGIPIYGSMAMYSGKPEKILVLSKINAPFLFGDIIHQEVPNIPLPEFTGYPGLSKEEIREQEYLEAIGILHKRMVETFEERNETSK